MTTYRYGPVAWLWRLLIFSAIAGGVTCVVFAVRSAALVLLAVAVSLLLPALFFGAVVATRIDHDARGSAVVRTLLFTRREVRRSQLGQARVRQHAQSEHGGTIYAPRAWISVKGGLPVYLDLLADIPDPRTFAAYWGVAIQEMPRRRVQQ